MEAVFSFLPSTCDGQPHRFNCATVPGWWFDGSAAADNAINWRSLASSGRFTFFAKGFCHRDNFLNRRYPAPASSFKDSQPDSVSRDHRFNAKPERIQSGRGPTCGDFDVQLRAECTLPRDVPNVVRSSARITSSLQ